MPEGLFQSFQHTSFSLHILISQYRPRVLFKRSFLLSWIIYAYKGHTCRRWNRVSLRAWSPLREQNEQKYIRTHEGTMVIYNGNLYQFKVIILIYNNLSSFILIYSNLSLNDLFGTNVVSCSLSHRRSIILSLQNKPFKVKRSAKRAHLFTHNHVTHTFSRSSFHHVIYHETSSSRSMETLSLSQYDAYKRAINLRVWEKHRSVLG